MITKLKHFYYDIKYVILNLWHHRKAIIHSRPWDSHGMLLFMRDNLKYLSDSIEKYGHSVNSHKDVKDMRICIHLLDRLIKDDYSKTNITKFVSRNIGNGYSQLEIGSEPKYFLPRGKLFKLEESIKKQDSEMLFKIINKHYRSWWD